MPDRVSPESGRTLRDFASKSLIAKLLAGRGAINVGRVGRREQIRPRVPGPERRAMTERWEIERDRYGLMFSGPIEVGECIVVVPEQRLRDAEAERDTLLADIALVLEPHPVSELDGCPLCGSHSAAHYCRPSEDARHRLLSAVRAETKGEES